jgi:uncharacterized phage protein (TIGR02218 family)
VSFDSDEKSRAGSQPVEGYKIELSTVTYRLTSAAHDVTISGEVYTASTISRGNVVATTNAEKDELVITLPVAHAIAQRFLQSGISPRAVKVTVFRQQPGGFEQWRVGYATSIAAEGDVASLRVPSLTADPIRRKLPVIGAGKLCPHVLYDTQCQISRASFKVTTTIANISGDTITVASMAPFIGQDHFAQYGELVHVPTGERRPIYDQVGNVQTLQMSIPEAVIGDAVEVYAGCDHSVETCQAKFTNVVNYGGFPELPGANPFQPAGFGTIAYK